MWRAVGIAMILLIAVSNARSVNSRKSAQRKILNDKLINKLRALKEVGDDEMMNAIDSPPGHHNGTDKPEHSMDGTYASPDYNYDYMWECDKFDCGNGNEICAEWSLCDTWDDCGNGADEPESCEYLECDGEQYPASWVCDGYLDCENSIDEEECEPLPDHFQCEETLAQVPESWICDCMDDCGDGSDEEGCGADCYVCPDGEVQPPSYECDGWPDCEDEADEKDCPVLECDGQVYPGNWICDGWKDCEDGSDEPEDCEEVMMYDVKHHAKGKNAKKAFAEKIHKAASAKKLHLAKLTKKTQIPLHRAKSMKKNNKVAQLMKLLNTAKKHK